MMKNVIYGVLELYSISSFVDIHHSMAQMMNKLLEKLRKEIIEPTKRNGTISVKMPSI
jgi:hypothetical protein